MDNPEGWFQLVEESRVRNPFKVVRMTQKDNFVDIGPMREKLTFRLKAVDGSRVKLQKAMRIKTDQCSPNTMFICYSHNPDEAWQEVNIGQRGAMGSINLRRLYTARREIAPPKLKDLKNLSAFIPVEHRAFYQGLQATIPSPRRLRTGAVLQGKGDESFDDESDLQSEIPSSSESEVDSK